MKKKALLVLAERLGPAIIEGGYARIIMKGYPLTITYSGVWHAGLAFEPDVVMKWQEPTLMALLETGVRDQACPFDETVFAHWEVGNPEQERRFQERMRRSQVTRSETPFRQTKPAPKKAPPKPKQTTTLFTSTEYEPALCHHCDQPIPVEASMKGSAFCCDRCAEVTRVIRSARVSIESGQYDETTWDGKPSMTRLVTDLKIAFVSFGDGYPKKARHLTKEQKQAIMYRDGGVCQMCGKLATDIDHIKGSSPDPSNLRALCKNCNVTRAIKKLPVLTPEQEAKKAAIWEAILADEPQRMAHDENLWKYIWREVSHIHKTVPIQAERERLFAELADRDYDD